MLCPLVLAVLVALSAAEPRPADLPLHVIVNESNPLRSIPREEVSAIFMRRTRSWPDGAEILPVDQNVRSPLRREFSRSVHGKSVAYVTRYWQRLIFSGRGVPPQQLDSDDDVMAFVAAHSGAIGYVSRDAVLREGVKVITVTE